MMAEADILPMLSAGDFTEVVNQVTAADLTADLGFSTAASSISQMQGGVGDNENHVSIDTPRPQTPPQQLQLVRALWTTSFLTLVPAISTTLYMPARGVVFGHNKLAYYTVLCVILALGLAEATTAFWLSCPGGNDSRRLDVGKVVLRASVLPLILVLGIAGYGFMEG